MKINFILPTDDKVHYYCIHCNSENIDLHDDARQHQYLCLDCKKSEPRLIMIDPKVVYWVDEVSHDYWHKSVGIFLINEYKEILLFKRNFFPVAYTIPAGHLDINEEPLTAIEREVKEETELNLETVRLFKEEEITKDPCRRGADHHYWYLYTSHIKKDIKIVINDEGASAVWLSLNQALEKNLTFPVKYFIEKYRDSLLK